MVVKFDGHEEEAFDVDNSTFKQLASSSVYVNASLNLEQKRPSFFLVNS